MHYPTRWFLDLQVCKVGLQEQISFLDESVISCNAKLPQTVRQSVMIFHQQLTLANYIDY